MPTSALDSSVIDDAVTSACRAPSLHNSQPWQWVYRDGQLRLFLDSSRIMDADHSAREALIGCGAALDHLRTAMAAAGWQAVIERSPDSDRPQYLATIDFEPVSFVTARDRLMADAIWTRRTDRLPFGAPTNWRSISSIWVSGAGNPSVHVETVPDGMVAKLEDAAQLAESLRLYDGAYHAELDWWTAPFENTEGIPHSSLVSASESDRVGIERVFPVISGTERRTEITEDHAAIMLLSTEGDSRADALAAGEALSATLLSCTVAGLATCTVTHLTELPATREVIRSLMNHDAVPQVLVRVGLVPVAERTPKPTPRRPLPQVLRTRAFD